MKSILCVHPNSFVSSRLRTSPRSGRISARFPSPTIPGRGRGRGGSTPSSAGRRVGTWPLEKPPLKRPNKLLDSCQLPISLPGWDRQLAAVYPAPHSCRRPIPPGSSRPGARGACPPRACAPAAGPPRDRLRGDGHPAAHPPSHPLCRPASRQMRGGRHCCRPARLGRSPRARYTRPRDAPAADTGEPRPRLRRAGRRGSAGN